jgi:magnesium transporter
VVREDVLEAMEPAEVAAAITELDTDDAVDVIEDLPVEDQRQILAKLSPSDRALLEEALTFPEDSAGRLMQREIVTVPENWTVGDTIDYMRSRATALPRDFYDVFAVDADLKPVGVLPLSRLMRNQRDIKVADIMAVDLHPVPLAMDQEEVALMFRQYGLVSAAVVDRDGRLAGVITADDVVHVVDKEAEEDLMRLGGVKEDDFYEAVLATTRARFPWLLVNLLTVIVASIVIGFFEQTIQKVVALAILMPIVASMGGNAGTQTLTVAVRALAMKELTSTNAKRVVSKEVIVGAINGLLFAGVMGPIAWLWFGEVAIGAVIAAAMIINLVAAGFVGIATPIVLERLGIDPAVASTVLLTAITDVVGFLAFLGLAALVLL